MSWSLISAVIISGQPPPPPVASVDEYGHLVTGSRTGDASLLVTAHEEFGTNQTLVMHIKVKKITPYRYIIILRGIIQNSIGGGIRSSVVARWTACQHVERAITH